MHCYGNVTSCFGQHLLIDLAFLHHFSDMVDNRLDQLFGTTLKKSDKHVTHHTHHTHITWFTCLLSLKKSSVCCTSSIRGPEPQQKQGKAFRRHSLPTKVTASHPSLASKRTSSLGVLFHSQLVSLTLFVPGA
jgi:hypothetical protein